MAVGRWAGAVMRRSVSRSVTFDSLTSWQPDRRTGASQLTLSKLKKIPHQLAPMGYRKVYRESVVTRACSHLVRIFWHSQTLDTVTPCNSLPALVAYITDPSMGACAFNASLGVFNKIVIAICLVHLDSPGCRIKGHPRPLLGRQCILAASPTVGQILPYAVRMLPALRNLQTPLLR